MPVVVNSGRGFQVGAVLLIAVAVVAAWAMHAHDKALVDRAVARESAAEVLATKWQNAAVRCGNGVEKMRREAAAAALEQSKREAAAIASAKRNARRSADQVLAIENAKVPAGCGEAVKWANVEAAKLGVW